MRVNNYRHNVEHISRTPAAVTAGADIGQGGQADVHSVNTTPKITVSSGQDSGTLKQASVSGMPVTSSGVRMVSDDKLQQLQDKRNLYKSVKEYMLTFANQTRAGTEGAAKTAYDNLKECLSALNTTIKFNIKPDFNNQLVVSVVREGSDEVVWQSTSDSAIEFQKAFSKISGLIFNTES